MRLDTPTTTPDDSAVVARSMSDVSTPVTPTLPSATTVMPSALYIRNHVAVPVATAVPAVMAFAVSTPLDGAPNAVAPNVSVASSVLPLSAVSAVAG